MCRALLPALLLNTGLGLCLGLLAESLLSMIILLLLLLLLGGVFVRAVHECQQGSHKARGHVRAAGA